MRRGARWPGCRCLARREAGRGLPRRSFCAPQRQVQDVVGQVNLPAGTVVVAVVIQGLSPRRCRGQACAHGGLRPRRTLAAVTRPGPRARRTMAAAQLHPQSTPALQHDAAPQIKYSHAARHWHQKAGVCISHPPSLLLPFLLWLNPLVLCWICSTSVL